LEEIAVFVVVRFMQHPVLGATAIA